MTGHSYGLLSVGAGAPATVLRAHRSLVTADRISQSGTAVCQLEGVVELQLIVDHQKIENSCRLEIDYS
ncbi:hypothetical protein ACFR99_02530 [Haloarchaeobius amylolyticus]|uniref:Halobacterial output domain-containing protein n=1 Tax=Haloarchaeobius amylolyticus TaxID=1198296 RepID=A0ABD6BCE4_9EURY